MLVCWLANSLPPSQDQYANMPFESWQLRPLGPNHTHLTITGGILEITVEIKVSVSNACINFSHCRAGAYFAKDTPCALFFR